MTDHSNTARSEADADRIRVHLEDVLASDAFARTIQIKQFLRYIVEVTLDGGADRLKAYAIAVDVFGKSPEHDPGSDAIVRVQARKLRARLNRYYANEGQGAGIHIHVPKGSYVPQLKIRSAAAHPAKAAPKLVRVSVSVSPFKNVSGVPMQDGVVHAISHSVAGAIARFAHIKVLTPQGPQTARYALTGTAAHSGGKLLASCHAIDQETGEVFSPERFEVPCHNAPFEALEDIAGLIAARFGASGGLLQRRAFGGTSFEDAAPSAAHIAFLCNEYMGHPSADKHAVLRGILEAVVAHDPRQDMAWAMLAHLYTDELRGGYNFRKFPAPMHRAKEAATTALRLNPTSTLSLTAGIAVSFNTGRFAACDRLITRGLEAYPYDPDVLSAASLVFFFQGRTDEALALQDRLASNGLFTSKWQKVVSVARLFHVHHDFDAVLEGADELGADFWGSVPIMKAAAYGLMGRSTDAHDIIDQFEMTTEAEARRFSYQMGLYHLQSEHIDLYIKGLAKTDLLKRPGFSVYLN